jgi:hypothetical protein
MTPINSQQGRYCLPPRFAAAGKALPFEGIAVIVPMSDPVTVL